MITWKRSTEDPIREWGQLLAYLPEIRRMIEQHGPSIIFLPSPQLKRTNLERAAELIGMLAADLGISQHEVRSTARSMIESELASRSEGDRFPGISQS